MLQPGLQLAEVYSPEAYSSVGQLENWRNLLLMANAVKYGFSDRLIPRPGTPIKVEEAKRRALAVERSWAHEQDTRDHDRCYSQAPKFSSCPVEFQCFLYKILISKPGKPSWNMEDMAPYDPE